MKRYAFLTVLLAVGILFPGHRVLAQAEAQMSSSEIRKAMFKIKAQGRETRTKLDETAERMVEVDDDLEARVDRLLGMLTQVSDSTESGTKVIRMKENLGEGLMESLKYYHAEREKVRVELDKPFRKLSKEQLEKEQELFEAKMEKRIDQILGLSDSLVQHKGYKKYSTHYQNTGHGGNRVIRETTDEYKQNRRASAKGARAKEGLSEGLRESAENLEASNKKLKDELALNLSQADRESIEAKIAKNTKLIEKRKKQLDGTLGAPAPATRSVGSRGAKVLRGDIQAEAEAVGAAWDELTALKNQFDSDRSKLRWLGARFELLKEKLAEAEGVNTP